MSKFENAFSNLGGNNEADSEFVAIDWAKVNGERAIIFDTPTKAKSRVGIISGIIDLGIQPVDDGHKKSDVAPEDEADYIIENPTNYFEDFTDRQRGVTERHVFWPQKAQRAVAITVDFPQYQFDWGGEIGVKPFRFLLNGEFINKGMKRSDIKVGRSYDLKETTKDFAPRWSLSKGGLLHKLAVATNLITADQPFSKQDIGKLIGKPALFEVRFWLDSGYANEKISFKGEVPEGMSVPDVDESTLYYINLEGDNDESAVKQLRKSIKNTIKASTSYAGSKLQQEYGELIEGKAKKEKQKEDTTETTVSGVEEEVVVEDTVVEKKAPPKKVKVEKVVKQPAAVEPSDYDDDIPF